MLIKYSEKNENIEKKTSKIWIVEKYRTTLSEPNKPNKPINPIKMMKFFRMPANNLFRIFRSIFAEKRSITITLFFIAIAPLLLFGQNTEYLYVQPKEKNAEPTQTSPPFTTHSALNAVLNTYGVTRYSQSFPGAKTPEVENTFEIHLTGNVTSLVSALNSMNLFEDVSIAEYYTLECDNPAPPVNDTYVQQGWVNNIALEMIEANCAWSITTGDPNISVAVVDTDFQLDHEDMENNFVSYWGNVVENSCSWHGTSVAGIIAAETNNNLGIASIGHDIKVAAYAVGANPGGNGCSGNPWPGVWQAYLDGHRVINVSWSGTGGPASAVLEMTQNGVILVVSAGNSPNSQSHGSIANLPGVINVTSVDLNNFHAPTGHAHNGHVDICAPGNNVTTLYPNDGYTGSWGTSFAAPMVSGTIGLMLSVNPCLTPGDVEEILKLTADPVADGASFPNQLGAGRVNAYQAVLMAQNHGIEGDIDATTTWNTPKFVSGDIFIQPGITLTITSEVDIAAGVNIHVLQNGRLIVDGGHLKNSTGCSNDLWGGIQVWGNTAQHQYSFSGGQYHQGRAIFRNGAVIENAGLGVTNWRVEDWNTRGGIIQTSTNTRFLNCRRAVAMMSYQNFASNNPTILRADQSRFTRTTFEINDDYPGDLDLQPVLPRITLWETDRVSILGCTFVNSSTVTSSVNRRVAIHSSDANYIVNDFCPTLVPWGVPCPNPVPSTFIGWHKGVEALGSVTSSRPMRIGNSVFEENMIGVEIRGADYSEIYKNEFKLGAHPFETWGSSYFQDRYHIGVYANSTLHFAIEQNDFSPSVTASYDGRGIMVLNSQGAENQVYKNTFSNLKTGTNGREINRNTVTVGGAAAGLAGLQFICNTNSNNEVDFEISRDGDGSSNFSFENSGIRQDQGTDFLPFPAENSFSVGHPNPEIYTHFTVNSSHVFRYYHGLNTTPPDLTEITPGSFVIQALDGTNTCPPNYTSGHLDGIVKSNLLVKKAEFDALVYTYNQIIDDGNTPGTISEIELTWPQDAWSLRDELMARSPYNSEEVLIAAVRRNIMPHAMLLEILLANPDALRSGNVIRIAESEVFPAMPDYMIDLLWLSRDETTLRTTMERNIADLHMDVQRMQKKIYNHRAFASDAESGPDSSLYYLGLVKTVEGNYSRVAALADHGNYSASINLLDSMIVNYRIKEDRLTEMNLVKNLYQIIGTAYAAGRTVANLDSTEIQSLIVIAEEPNGGLGNIKAQNVLCFHYNICFDDEGQPKNAPLAQKSKPTYEELLAELNTTNAYPNPSDQYITISYTLLTAKEQTSLILIDNLGRKIEERKIGENYEGQELFDTRKFATGVYLYQIVQEGKKISNGKFIVTH